MRLSERSERSDDATARRVGVEGDPECEAGGYTGRAVRTSCRADRAGCWRDSAPDPAELARPERNVLYCASIIEVKACGNSEVEDATGFERTRMLVWTK